MRLLAPAVVLLAACAGGPVGEDAEAAPLTAALRVEPRPAPPGGTMSLALEVANRGDTAVSLDFPTGQRVDFAVRRGGDELARWSSGMTFTQVLGTEVYGPGETDTLEAEMAAPAAPGEYTVVGWLTSSGPVVRDSVRLTVR